MTFALGFVAGFLFAIVGSAALFWALGGKSEWVRRDEP